MKFIVALTLMLFASGNILARNPGTGSNTTVGPGPATTDSTGYDTSIMGGGTPGNSGEDNLDTDEPQQREEERKKRESKMEKEDITDQNSNLDTL